jgi:cell division transport system permease protein
MQNQKKLKRKVRNSYVISTVSIAMVLFLLASVGYLIINVVGAASRMRDNVAMYVMLKDGLSEEQNARIKVQLEGIAEVSSVTYVSKDKAAKDFVDYTGDDFRDFIDFNPLPDSYELKVDMSAGGKTLSALDREIAAWPEVDEVVYQKNVAEQIGTNINRFNMVLIVFGLALLVISLILLNNTIRITIFAKKHVISTMKLVGASKWFVMRPFIRTAILQGIYAALIGSVMFVALVSGLNEKLPEIALMRRTELLYIIAAMFVLGVLISLLFTIFAVGKFIRMRTSAIHLY